MSPAATPLLPKENIGGKYSDTLTTTVAYVNILRPRHFTIECSARMACVIVLVPKPPSAKNINGIVD
jgi:hypothetical protein